MGMDWPEEERRDFANSRTYEDDGVAVVFVTSADTSLLEMRWTARLYGGERLPNLRAFRMAGVRTVIAPSVDLPGAGLTFYLRSTEDGWRVFDVEVN
jgi:hypothetical protein